MKRVVVVVCALVAAWALREWWADRQFERHAARVDRAAFEDFDWSEWDQVVGGGVC